MRRGHPAVLLWGFSLARAARPPPPRDEPGQERAIGHGARGANRGALREKARSVLREPAEGRQRAALHREARGDDDEIAGEGARERRLEVLFPRVVDPEEKAVLDGMQIRRGRHLAAPLGQVAPAVPRPGGGNAAGGPTAAAEPPC